MLISPKIVNFFTKFRGQLERSLAFGAVAPSGWRPCRLVVHRHKTVMLYAACLLACAMLSGCNRTDQGDSPPNAAINGTEGTVAPAMEDDARTTTKRPSADPRHPEVLIRTSLGDIRVRLDGVNSPLTVDNFLCYVESGHYDQTIVHQVYRDQGIIAGGYGVNRAEKRSRTPIRNEAHNGLRNRRGTISMVRFPDAIDSATCQFFVNVSDNPALDHKARTPEGYGYCVFGEVVDGMDVVDRINDAPLQDAADFERTPVNPIVIESIRRVQ